MSDIISQAEIDALLSGAAPDAEATAANDTSMDSLSSEQRDILGEVGNISMGTAATTLSTLLNQKVWITTPKVSTSTWKELAKGYERPCVGVRVGYTEGLEGTNVLILNQLDVKIITNLMLGGDGAVDPDEEIGEMQLSAISEAMNQMVGSSSTSISSLINTKIDISTPQAFILNFENDDFFENIGFGEEGIVLTKFRMEIGTLIDSEIVQILERKFAGGLVDRMKAGMMGETAEAQKPSSAPAAAAPQPMASPQQQATMQSGMPYSDGSAMQQPYPQQPYQQQPYPQQPYQQQPYQAQGGVNNYMPQSPANVNVQPVQFQNFDMESVVQQKENIGIIMDVPLEVTVELGRTSKKIKEILEFSPGSIIELDKLAGEPIDILVNGKFVAKGEVVVIDENFGIRITDIISVENRI